MIINEEHEIPKYKKKSSKKGQPRAKHKHIYKDCLLMKEDGSVSKASVCSICGKVDDVKIFESVVSEEHPKCYRMLSNKEILEKYKGLEIIKVSDMFVKKVDIKKSEV